MARKQRLAFLEHPSFIAPMALQSVRALPEGPEWIYEIKWDGYRAIGVKQGDRAHLFSRNNKPLSSDFPLIAEQLRRVSAKSAVIDGEIVAVDHEGRPSFQALQNRRSRASTIVFYAFDLLHLNGRSLTAEPIEKRRAALQRVLNGSGILLSASLPGRAADVISAAEKMGLEGIVAKRHGSPYRSGDRNHDWKKLRLHAGQELVIGGYTPGRPFDALLVGYYEASCLRFAGKVRAGFTPHSRKKVWEMISRDRAETCPFADLPNTTRKGRWGEGITAADMESIKWVKPRHVAQINFVEWTQGGHLRHPTFVGMRTDKRPRSVNRESS